MIVILYFGAFNDGEAQMRENLVDVAAHDGERMPCATHFVGRHTHVEAGIVAVLVLKFLQLLLHLVLNDILQFVQSHTHLLAEFGRNGLEVGKQGGNDAFLA